MKRHVIFWILEFGLCFVFTLNLHMRGRLTTTIGSILGLLIFSMVIAAIFILGWGYAALSFLLMWVFVAVSKPFAGKIAFRLLGYCTGIESPAYERSPVEDLMSGRTTVDDMLKRIGEQNEQERARLASIASRPAVARILQENGVGDEEFQKLHLLLVRSSLPDLAWEILADPDDLLRLIEFHRQGLHPAEVHSRFRQFT